jgi:indolepyruvate ferredoxin oxidoreductase, beta subunit
MKNNTTNILIAGVGGQGILLASEILSEALMLAGFDVKKNEIHGMSQRGGSVVSHIRFGAKVYSPIIPDGEGGCAAGFRVAGDLPLSALAAQGMPRFWPTT